MENFFTLVLYQPFLNILVFFYWLIGLTPIGYDMGIAVILLTITIRLLLLPVTLASHRSESERRELMRQIQEVKEHHYADPVARQKATKAALRSKPRILFAEGAMFLIQTAIALILWRIFATGLSGEDLHLLYRFMPDVPEPFVLTFLRRFDLTHPDLLLNLVQTLLIFALETLAVILSPYPVSRKEVVRVQIVLPLVSFVVFAFLPAGKKLFVITTLLFSITVMIARQVVEWWHHVFGPDEEVAVPLPEVTTPPAPPANPVQ